jgi:hypothetical protein
MTLPFKQASPHHYMLGRYVTVTAITIIGPDFRKDFSGKPNNLALDLKNSHKPGGEEIESGGIE